MKKQLLLLPVVIFLIQQVHGQQIFIGQVSVDYAKTVAVWPLMKEMEPEWFEREKDYFPKETISYFNFTGDTARSVFRRTKEADIPRNLWYRPLADENVVYNDYVARTTITQKPVYEETYLMQDSLLKIKWKITADTRNIAGFNCRKAIGFLFDTVAVFAFYTDEILISGGPEGIHGLPGMILGIGIPRLHTTWFATRVTITDVNMNHVTPAVKGKKINRANMLSVLNKAMKNWDQYGQKMLLAVII